MDIWPVPRDQLITINIVLITNNKISKLKIVEKAKSIVRIGTSPSNIKQYPTTTSIVAKTLTGKVQIEPIELIIVAIKFKTCENNAGIILFFIPVFNHTACGLLHIIKLFLRFIFFNPMFVISISPIMQGAKRPLTRKRRIN